MITSPICFSCRWLNDKPNENDDLTCRAFPRGIPQEILDGYDHTRPYPGDSGVVFESLETVSANQKSLEGVSNRPDDSGDPLDLLEGSERVRKYNPYHDRLGRFSTGSGGGSGVNVAGSDEEFAFLKDAQYRRTEDPATGATIDQDEGLVLLMENRGYFGKPDALEHGAFEKTDKLSLDMQYGSEKSPTSVFYRGIQDDGWGVGVEAMTKGLTEGTSRFHGVGSYGNGLYFAAEQRLAVRYAGTSGMVQRVALKPDAKVITSHELVAEAFKLHGELGLGYNNIREHGRLATWLGYDVIHADDRLVVLNHSKLIIDKSSLVRISREEKSLDLFDVELKFNPNHSPVNGRFTSRAGGSGINVAGSDEEFAFLKDAEYKRVIDPTTGAEIDVDEGLVLLMENRGFYGKPTTLEKAEFNRAEKLSLDMEYGYDPRNSSPTNIYPTTDFYRGIQNVPGVPVEKMSDSLVDGSSRFHGVGTFGNGLYFSPDPRRARGYAGDQGMLQRMALKPDAKVITKHALVEEAFKLHGELGMGYNNVSELGRLATWLGYDVIHADDRIVVLNHSKLIIDKSSLVRLPREKSLDLFDIELKFNPNHDRRGRFAASSGGRDLLGDDPSTVSEEWAQSLLDQREYGLNIDEMSADDERISRSGGDTALSRIVDEQWGGAGTVRVADLGNANDANLLFRGVEGSTDYHTGFINGDRFMGKGVYGNGIYFAQGGEFSVPGSALFQDNVGNAWSKAEGYGSNVRKYRISSSAKIVDWEALAAEHTAWLNKTEQGPVRSLTKDPGRYAALKGYDGIKSPPKKGVSQYVIFNRGVLEAHVDRQPDFSFNKSVTIKYNPNHSPTTGRFVSAHTFRDGAPSDDVKDLLAKTLDPLSDAEKNSLSAYTSTSYAGINRYAWMDPSKSETFGGRPVDNLDIMYPSDYNLRHFTIMSGALEKTKTPVDLVVSHRMKAGERFFDSNGASMDASSVGKTLTNKGFTSASLSKNVHLANTNWELEVPKGSKGAYVNPISSHKDEYEIILQRGAKFKITEFETDGLVTNIKARVVGFEPLESLDRRTKNFTLKYNPNHDRMGRFASGGGGGGGGPLHDTFVAYPEVDGWSKRMETRSMNEKLPRPLSEEDLATLPEETRLSIDLFEVKYNPFHDERGRFASSRAFFTGEPVNNPAPLSKAETGRLGEQAAMLYLGESARTLNVNRNNYPVDVVSHDRVVEVKTGLSTNPKASQQWRATIGQPGKKESEWLKTATLAEKKAWNDRKRQAILDRKQKAVDEVQKLMGRKLKPTTLGVIIDPHTREAHVYEFEGFHLRIGWSDKGVKEAYRASYKL